MSKLWNWITKIIGKNDLEKYLDPVTLIQEQYKVVAVDYDGCICFWKFPESGDPYIWTDDNGKPLKFYDGKVFTTIELLRKFRKAGWKIIIHTSRVNKHWVAEEREICCGQMLLWLKQHRVPFDSVWGMRYIEGNWTFCDDDIGKPVCSAYIDDFGCRVGSKDIIGIMKDFSIS